MKHILVLFALLGCSASLHAQDNSNTASTVSSTLERIDAVLDYTIGSQRSLSSRRGKPEIDIDFPRFGWNVGASCSGWDVGVSFDGLIDDAESQLNRMQRNVVNSIRGFITSLPMLLLQREDPGLYEMLNNMLINGENIFQAKAETCRNMSERFAKSKDGLGALQDSSFWVDFGQKEQSGRKSGGDLVKTIDDAEENKGEAGVIGMGGEMCGGVGQASCKPVEAAAREGFERLAENAGVNQNGDPIVPWYKQIWSASSDASKWIKTVVGDVQYATCKGCEKLKQTPGIGVYDDIANEANAVRELLREVVSRTDVPNLNDLKRVSSNDVFVSESVIFALRDESVQQELFLSRIAEEIALLKTVDKLLAARRILMAGKADPSFSSTDTNISIIDAKIKILADEVSLLKEELELKKVARGDTMRILLSRYESRRTINPQSSYDSEVQRRVKEGVQKVNGSRE